MTFTEDDLRAVLTERGESASIPTDLGAVAARRGRTIRRRRRGAGVAAVLVCVGVAAAIGVRLDLGRADRDVLSPAAHPSISPQVAAKRSVVRITAGAPSCDRTIYSTGFVFAPERVMTVATGLAGASRVDVRTAAGGPAYRARVVEYDPRRDVAVLFVPGLRAPAMSFTATGHSGDPVVVAEFPRGRPSLSLTTGRIVKRQQASGPDIYHRGQVTREIYLVQTTVVHIDVPPDVEGRPLIATDGSVYGLAFAGALDAPEISYALTANEVAPIAQHGRTATKPVSTQACAD